MRGEGARLSDWAGGVQRIRTGHMRRSMFCDKYTMPIPNWHARTRDAHDCCSMYGAWLVVIALMLRYRWHAFCFDHRQARNHKLGWLLARCFGKLGRHLRGRRHTGSFNFGILDIGMSTSSSGIWPEREQATRMIHLVFRVDQSWLWKVKSREINQRCWRGKLLVKGVRKRIDLW